MAPPRSVVVPDMVIRPVIPVVWFDEFVFHSEQSAFCHCTTWAAILYDTKSCCGPDAPQFPLSQMDYPLACLLPLLGRDSAAFLPQYSSDAIARGARPQRLARIAEDLGEEYYAKKFVSNDLPMSPVAATGGNWWSEMPDGQKCFWFAAILLMLRSFLAAR